MKWVGGKYSEFGGEIERTHKRECQLAVREQRKGYFYQKMLMIRMSMSNLSAVKFCLRRAAFCVRL